jgi:alanyl-tRNA synthetase
VLSDVESRVNDVLSADLHVHAEVMPIDAARAMGAMALFGEKYGNDVRVVSVGDWAHELCGGTHAQRSGQLGVVTFLSEGSIGAGVRRIEALVGVDAYRHLAREHILVSRLAEMLKAPGEEIPDRIESLLTRLKDAEREIARARSVALSATIDDILGTPADLAGVRVWTFTAPDGTSAGDLRDVVTRGRANARPDVPAVVAGASVEGERVAVAVAVNEAARTSGVSAAVLLRALLPAIDGRGGGKDDMAQGGGTNTAGIDAGFSALRDAMVAGGSA